jgi:predicted HAD superfamily Cof-like phosphohydrolase
MTTTDVERMETKGSLVAEFHDAFGLTGQDTVELRERLIREEVEEVREAFLHLLKEMADLQYVIVGGLIEETEISAELWDTIGTVAGPFSLIPPQDVDEAFKRVHESNMSKLGEDGKPIRREDGKVLKGPGYFEPNLFDLLPA